MAPTKYIKLKGHIVGDGLHEAFKSVTGVDMITIHALSSQRLNKLLKYKITFLSKMISISLSFCIICIAICTHVYTVIYFLNDSLYWKTLKSFCLQNLPLTYNLFVEQVTIRISEQALHLLTYVLLVEITRLKKKGRDMLKYNIV